MLGRLAAAVIAFCLLPCRFLAASQVDIRLIVAIQSGQVDRVRTALALGSDVTGTDELGNTPLLYAAMGKHTAIALYLIGLGAQVNRLQPQTGFSPLHYAILNGDSTLLEALFQARADVRLHSPGKPDALHLAAEQGATQAAGMLLNHGAAVNGQDDGGNTPLDLAVKHKQGALGELLLRSGADVHRLYQPGNRNIIHQAAVQNVPSLIPPLVAAGADDTLLDDWGESPLDLALAYKSSATVAVLMGLSSGNARLQVEFDHAMQAAVQHGRTEIAGMLLGAGWDVNRLSSDGSFYLNDAALKGQLKTVKLLLNHGAKLESRNSAGGTALHDAATSGNAELVAYLLDRGCLPDTRAENSQATPLMLAVELSRRDVVAVLMRRGANPLLKDANGKSARDRAAETQDLVLTQLLRVTSTPTS